ncbi:MAG: RNA 2',3'-cyclic phosphodiesterase [Bacteroidales bacterium]|nr:RNA 2',3'-cyclic phosphodiesterase [Lentimicrobiaceae bacterium]MDD5694765.1 RNA 2',3'-cyclic phosphodiesterase [Bacteroidales bacterium]
MKRLFVAIKLHPADTLLEVFRFLKKNLHEEKIKWVEEYNLHLTLKFFGETEEERIPAIRQALKAAAGRSAGFKLELKGTGIFGSKYDPRVVWLGIETNPALQQLYANMWEEIGKLGYVPDSQNFVPHLTIGRIKFIRDKRFFQEVILMRREDFLQRETVRELYLFESILQPTGPVYKVIENFVLR